LRPYVELPALHDLYLEESYVLAIVAEPELLTLELDLVLTEGHPAYRSPKPGERYAYRRGRLRFTGVTELRWTGQGRIRPAIDATGELDHGSIDVLEFEGRGHRIEGDFGLIEVDAAAVSVELADD
jgi:hypothetical protein